MPRQYIDPQPFKDRIAELENENQQLKAELDAAKAGETVAGEAELKAKLEAAEKAIAQADEAFGPITPGDPDSPHAPGNSQVGITEPQN